MTEVGHVSTVSQAAGVVGFVGFPSPTGAALEEGCG